MHFLLIDPIGISEELRIVIEVGLIFFTLYSLYMFLRKTGGASILKGMLILMSMYLFGMFVLSMVFELHRILYILRSILGYLVISILIIFQYEFRRGLIRISQTRLLGTFFGTETEKIITQIVNATTRMAQSKTGALIVIEKGVNLTPYTERGVTLDSKFSSELLTTLFYKGTALHDGAVIIRNDRVLAAACLLPLSDNPNISRRIGTRHRAGIGITEQSDALSVIVSEETGLISIARDGQLKRGIDRDGLYKLLLEFFREKVEISAELKLSE